MTDAFILGGVRTPVGRYGGSLSHVRTDDLLGQTMVAACERVGVPLDRVEDITAGCVNVAHEGMGDIARWGALAAGFPDSVPAVTVNRFCASSLTGAISIAHAIRSDELGVGVAAGVESMSRSGWANMKGDAPFSPRGPVLLLDTMWAGAGGPPNPVLLARNAYVEMIKTAQNVADRYELSREEIDAFALRSHHHAAAARDSGRFAAEIHPIEIPGTRTAPNRIFEHDEMIRSDTTAERLAALPPQPNTTQMTAGNSSPLSDGASAVVLASAEAAQSLGVTPWPGSWPRRRTPSIPSSWGSRPPSPSPRRCSEPDWRRPTSTCGRCTRPSRPRRSACSASCRTSWTVSWCPTTA